MNGQFIICSIHLFIFKKNFDPYHFTPHLSLLLQNSIHLYFLQYNPIFTVISHLQVRCVIFLTSYYSHFHYDEGIGRLSLKIGGRSMAKNKHGGENLKGTLYMVFAVGLVIIGVWAYCFSLFINRF